MEQPLEDDRVSDCELSIQKISIDRLDEIAQLAVDPVFRSKLDMLTKLLRHFRSPWLKRKGFFINILQKEVLRGIFQYQQQIENLKRELPTGDKGNARRIRILEAWVRIMKTIMDGVAWRNLGFNRPLMRIFSENDSPGHLKETGVESARDMLNRSHKLLIVNDLTRCLRVADYTVIADDGTAVILESKQSGREIKTAGSIARRNRKYRNDLSPQEQRHLTVQTALDHGVLVVFENNDGKAGTNERNAGRIVHVNFPIKHRFNETKILLRALDAEPTAGVLLETGYYLEATAYDTLVDMQNERKAIEESSKRTVRLRPNWYGESDVIEITSYLSIMEANNQFSRNWLPASVLPFSAGDCIRLMAGQVEVHSYVRIADMIDRFEADGWTVMNMVDSTDITHRKAFDRERGEFFRKRVDDRFLSMNKIVDGRDHSFDLPMTWLLMTMSSFYSLDFLVDVANAFITISDEDCMSRCKVACSFDYERNILV